MSNSSNVQYLSTTEFANRYNASMTIDKDHMPLEPSFVKLLCEQGQIEHSVIPARDGRKRDTLMIPEYELDKLDILINGEKAVKAEAKPKLASEKKFLTTKDVAELLGCDVSYVNALARDGKLKVAKVSNSGKGIRNARLYDEDYILQYMEEHPMRKYTKKEKPIEVKAEEIQEPKQASEDLSKFQKRIDELLDALNDAQKDIQRLTEKNKLLLTVNEELSKKTVQEPVAKDIFEAYRKGFKDGYEMGGGK